MPRSIACGVWNLIPQKQDPVLFQPFFEQATESNSHSVIRPADPLISDNMQDLEWAHSCEGFFGRSTGKAILNVLYYLIRFLTDFG